MLIRLNGGIILIVLAVALAGVAAFAVPAFPWAEGFGAAAPGGRGGAVVLVTNLEDYVPGKETPIPGSLRAAVETRGPRIAVFRTGGAIELKAHLVIREPYLTFAGQTATGDGVCLKNYACLI